MEMVVITSSKVEAEIYHPSTGILSQMIRGTSYIQIHGKQKP